MDICGKIVYSKKRKKQTRWCAEEALCQSAKRQYDAALRNDGYKHVSCYGIAFCGKECAVHCRACPG